jgi:hypothetical protein
MHAQHENKGFRPRRARARSGGQVLIILVMSMVLLAALSFYVYNFGYVVNTRLEIQTAADEAAISGGTWMARSMNVVAMGNVAEAKMASLAPVLDSMPLASKMALDEVTAWEQCLGSQLATGMPNQHGEGPLLQTGMESLRSRMAQQRDILTPFSDTLNGGSFDIQEITTWNVRGNSAPLPHGKLWQAAVSLDEFSQAAVVSAPLLAQEGANRMGRANGAETAFLTPIVPRMPAVRTNFHDYEPLIRGRETVRGDQLANFSRTGGNGGAIPDAAWPHRLGPYARLLKWRDAEYTHVGGDPGDRHWVQDSAVRGGGGVSVGGRRVGSSARGGGSGHWEGTPPSGGQNVLVGYTTYGPYNWALRQIADAANGPSEDAPGLLRDTYFYSYLRTISGMKLDYMFRPPGTQAQLKSIHYPQWHTSYPESVRLSLDPNVRITRTMFYLVEVASSVPEGGAGWLTPGTYRTNGQRPIAIWVNQWSDPAKWGIPKVADYVWKDSYSYETTADPEIGIQMTRDPVTGEPQWHPVYMVSWYTFGGIDTGGEVEIRNPCNWDEYDTLPAPYLLDTSFGDYAADNPHHDGGVRRALFSYLGVATHPEKPLVPIFEKFGTVNPSGDMAAVAQVETYNNLSWDLWTQNWRSQLVRVTQWDDWMNQMNQGAPQADATGVILTRDVSKVLDYLSRFDRQTAETYLRH